ncbi:MAG: hypothetical protein ACRDRJ_02775 [Streptosporangiaceae bacterium]
MNRRALGLLTAAAAVGGLITTAAGPAAAARVPSATVTIGTRTSGVFDGIGAILGGGGSARLLADYAPAVRSQIYNYLFRPGDGAALQMLKLEIGSGTNSSDAAEPSVEPSAGRPRPTSAMSSPGSSAPASITCASPTSAAGTSTAPA